MCPGYNTPPVWHGRYRPGDPVMRGGTTEVRVAFPIGSPAAEPVAIKYLQAAFANDPDAITELRREATLLAAMEHPSIVRVIEACGATQPPFLVMEYLGGGSLQRLAKAGVPLGAMPVAALLRSTANALAWLHRRGIVHGDVKPANLVRNGAGVVKLIDFGAARILDRPLQSAPLRLATPSYAAPEQLLGLAPDPRDDVFSLAIVLYELVAGRHPFAGDPVVALGAPPRPAGLNDEAWYRLRAALAPERIDRPHDPWMLIAGMGQTAGQAYDGPRERDAAAVAAAAPCRA